MTTGDREIRRIGRFSFWSQYPNHFIFTASTPIDYNQLGKGRAEPISVETSFAIDNVEYILSISCIVRGDKLSLVPAGNNCGYQIEIFNLYDHKKYNVLFQEFYYFDIFEYSRIGHLTSYIYEKFLSNFFSSNTFFDKMVFQDIDLTKNLFHLVVNSIKSFIAINFIDMENLVEERFPDPPAPREMYQDRMPIVGKKREGAAIFARRVWGDYIEAGRLYAKSLSSIDRPLYMALRYLSEKGDISLSDYVRISEARTMVRVKTCIHELASLSNQNQEIRPELLRQISLLTEKITNQISD